MSVIVEPGIDGTTSSYKTTAISFLRMLSTGEVRAAYDQYVGRDFRHHNPHYRGDRESLMAGMEEMRTKHPDSVLQVERALEDADLVAVHSRVRLAATGPEMAVVHIFRFVGGRIVELWDIGQPVLDDSRNENGMF